jgi:HSP20 family molecular chaperone IbpA
VDIYDAGDALLVVASAPGTLPEDVRIEISGTVVTVAVTQRPFPIPAGCATIRRERYAAPLERAIELPFAVEASDVSQALERGVLALRIAKPASFQGAE